MQRAAGNSGVRGEHQIIEIPNLHLEEREKKNKSPSTKTKKMQFDLKTPTPTSVLPVFFKSNPTRLNFRFMGSPDKWVHLIPLFILLTFFFLWWFSSPVNLEVKDGRTTQVHPTEKPLSINETDTVFDLGRLTILAVSTSPNPSLSLELNLTMIDKNGVNDI